MKRRAGLIGRRLEWRSTVALYDERGRHIGYYHLPTAQLTTPAGTISCPTRDVCGPLGGPKLNRSHAARLRAADRAGLIVVGDLRAAAELAGGLPAAA